MSIPLIDATDPDQLVAALARIAASGKLAERHRATLRSICDRSAHGIEQRQGGTLIVNERCRAAEDARVPHDENFTPDSNAAQPTRSGLAYGNRPTERPTSEGLTRAISARRDGDRCLSKLSAATVRGL